MNCKRKSRRRFFLLMCSRTPPISSEFRGGGLNTPPRHATGVICRRLHLLQGGHNCHWQWSKLGVLSVTLCYVSTLFGIRGLNQDEEYPRIEHVMKLAVNFPMYSRPQNVVCVWDWDMIILTGSDWDMIILGGMDWDIIILKSFGLGHDHS